jgi:hypothetical protein
MAFDYNTLIQRIRAASHAIGREAGQVMEDLVTHLRNLTSTELGFIDGVTAGTASANKAAVLGANKDIDTMAFGAITGADASLGINGQAGAQGGAVAIAGGASSASNNAGGAASQTGGAGNGTGNGGDSSVVGGASGAGATGNGGAAKLTGGAAASTNGNGGAVVLTPGAKSGTGKDGVILERGVKLVKQGAPTAKTDGAVLTAAELLTGIITTDAADDAADNYQLPEAANLDTELPDAAAGDAFDFSVINIGTNANEDVTITTNTGWTLVGNMVVASNAAATDQSAGRFRARKTGAGAWTLYRIA